MSHKQSNKGANNMKKHGIILFIAICLVVGLGISVKFNPMDAMAAGGKAITPSTHGNWDLGTAALSYKDIRILGDLYSNGTKIIDSGNLVSGNLGADSVGSVEVNYVENKVIIAAPATVGTATVTSGAIVIGIVGIANINAANELPVTAIINGTTLYLDLLGAVDTDTAIYNVITLDPI